MAADRFFDCDGWERRDGSSRVYATGAMLKPGQSSLGLTIILENSEKLVGAFCDDTNVERKFKKITKF